MAEMSEIKGDSAEAVAWAMLITIAKAEGGYLDKEKAGWSKDKILAVYRECLAAIRPGSREPPVTPSCRIVAVIRRVRPLWARPFRCGARLRLVLRLGDLLRTRSNFSLGGRASVSFAVWTNRLNCSGLSGFGLGWRCMTGDTSATAAQSLQA